MIAPYPDPKARLSEEELQARREADAPASEEVELLIDLVRAIRNVRAELKIDPQSLLDATVATSRQAGALEAEADAIRSLARVGALRFGDADTGEDAVRLVVRDVTVALNVGGSVDLEAERGRLRGETASVQKHLAGLEGRLGSSQFLDKAPARCGGARAGAPEEWPRQAGTESPDSSETLEGSRIGTRTHTGLEGREPQTGRRCRKRFLGHAVRSLETGHHGRAPGWRWSSSPAGSSRRPTLP